MCEERKYNIAYELEEILNNNWKCYSPFCVISPKSIRWNFHISAVAAFKAENYVCTQLFLKKIFLAVLYDNFKKKKKDVQILK